MSAELPPLERHVRHLLAQGMPPFPVLPTEPGKVVNCHLTVTYWPHMVAIPETLLDVDASADSVAFLLRNMRPAETAEQQALGLDARGMVRVWADFYLADPPGEEPDTDTD